MLHITSSLAPKVLRYVLGALALLRRPDFAVGEVIFCPHPIRSAKLVDGVVLVLAAEELKDIFVVDRAGANACHWDRVGRHLQTEHVREQFGMKDQLN